MNENLPTGVTVLCHNGDGPAPVERILAATAPESDPDREGIRLLLASLLPSPLSLDEFVTTACCVFEPLKQFAPEVVADVARRLGVV